MAITPTVEEMMGSRPTAEHPLNSALDAMLVKKRISQYVQNLQESALHVSANNPTSCLPHLHYDVADSQ